jgi:hypothetical protein
MAFRRESLPVTTMPPARKALTFQFVTRRF